MSGLEVRALTRRFAGLTAVSNVTFDVVAGSITALIGPNGAGKTTCFNVIAGAMPPSEGDVRFDGRTLVGESPENVCRAGVARTFQIVRPLAGMTALENVIVAALLRDRTTRAAAASARAVLDRVGLGPKADTLASDLTLPDRKMLELAKALATRPRLLMLDEVMAGLRPTEADRMAEVLRTLNADGLTVFLIEHVMRVVMAVAQKVIVLHHGEKIAEGPPESVVADPQVIECYLGKKGRPA